jgi:hypothetical protein
MATKYVINGQSCSKEEFVKRSRSGRLEEVFRTREFPGIQDDTTFMAGRGTLEDQLGAEQAEFVAKEAMKQGYKPSPNDVYLPGIADCVGDKNAFVKQDGAKGHVRKVCEDNGWRCEGSVKVNPVKREEGDPGFTRPTEADCKLESLGKRDPIKI